MLKRRAEKFYERRKEMHQDIGEKKSIWRSPTTLYSHFILKFCSNCLAAAHFFSLLSYGFFPPQLLVRLSFFVFYLTNTFICVFFHFVSFHQQKEEEEPDEIHNRYTRRSFSSFFVFFLQSIYIYIYLVKIQ